MAKHKNSVVARTEYSKSHALTVSDFVGSRWAAIETAGAMDAAKASNGTQRSLQAICAPNGFSALIKTGKTTIQFQGDSFAISTHD